MSRIKEKINTLLDSLCWFKQRLTNVDNCFITCSGKTDGAGAQIQAVLSTMLFANELGIKYIHTPFKKIEHNIENDKFFESKWESLVNLGFNELSIGQIKLDKLDIVQVGHPREVKKIENTLYVIPQCHKFVDRDPNLYLKLLPKFQQKYAQSSKKPNLYFDPSKINVAIHIRRGVVTKKSSKKYTSNQLILSLIKSISSALSDLGVKPIFYIFSQGNMEEFLDIHLDRVIFHLNECPFTTFHNMVSADVLVMAKSSFSYSAALFSKGAIIYLPFWHKPLRNWVVVDKNGSFDKEDFKDMVRQKTIRKFYNSECQSLPLALVSG